MKKFVVLFVSVALFGAVIIASCGGEEKDMKADTKEVSKMAEEAMADVKDSAMDLAVEKKDEFISGIKTKLESWDGKVADLKKKVESLNPTAKQLVDKPMAQLMEKKDAVFKKFEALKSDTTGDWPQAASEMTGSVKELGTAYDKVVSLIK